MLSAPPLESRQFVFAHVFGVEIDDKSKVKWAEALALGREWVARNMNAHSVHRYGSGDFSCSEGMPPVADQIKPVVHAILATLNNPDSFARRTRMSNYSPLSWTLVSSQEGAQSRLNAVHIDYVFGKAPFAIWVAQKSAVGTSVFVPPWETPEPGRLISVLASKGKGTDLSDLDSIETLLQRRELKRIELPPTVLWVLSSSTLHCRGHEDGRLGESWRDLIHIRFV